MAEKADRLATALTSHPGRLCAAGDGRTEGRPPVALLAGVPSRAGSPGHTPDGASKGRGQGWRLGWGGGYDRPQAAGSSSRVVKLPAGTEAGPGGGRQVARPRRAAVEAGRGCWEVRPAGRLGDGLLAVTAPSTRSLPQSCLALGDPVDCSPPGSSVRFPGKNAGVGCHCLF